MAHQHQYEIDNIKEWRSNIIKTEINKLIAAGHTELAKIFVLYAKYEFEGDLAAFAKLNIIATHANEIYDKDNCDILESSEATLIRYNNYCLKFYNNYYYLWRKRYKRIHEPTILSYIPVSWFKE